MLVSKAELQQYMNNLGLTIPQGANVEAVLSGVQSELELYCNRTLELVQVREMVMTDGTGYANVSYSPVVKVIRVDALNQIDTTFLPATPVYVPEPFERDVLMSPEGVMIDRLANIDGTTHIVVPGGIYVGTGDSWQIVEYVAGYVGPHTPAVKAAIKRVAAREVTRTMDDTVSLRDGDAQQASEPDNRPVGWTEDELRQFDRLRRRVIA